MGRFLLKKKKTAVGKALQKIHSTYHLHCLQEDLQMKFMTVTLGMSSKSTIV